MIACIFNVPHFLTIRAPVSGCISEAVDLY